MNIVFWFLIILVIFLLWFFSFWAYRIIGKFLKMLWEAHVEEINLEDEEKED